MEFNKAIQSVSITWKSYSERIQFPIPNEDIGDIELYTPACETYIFKNMYARVYNKYMKMFKKAGSNYYAVLNMMTRDHGSKLDDDTENERQLDLKFGKKHT